MPSDSSISVISIPSSAIMASASASSRSKICGSVISTIKPENGDRWAQVKEHNDQALALKELYGDFYVPGFHVHPDFLEQSLEEMYRMQNAGVHLIGELVPYIDEWSVNYASDAFSVL